MIYLIQKNTPPFNFMNLYNIKWTLHYFLQIVELRRK